MISAVSTNYLKLIALTRRFSKIADKKFRPLFFLRWTDHESRRQLGGDDNQIIRLH
jgi:hypothetical protein